MMKARLLLLVSVFLFFACSLRGVKTPLLDNNTFLLTEISTDSTYGYTEENPIKVGGVNKGVGPLNEERFLNALAGPNGEEVSYKRAGSCCPLKKKNRFLRLQSLPGMLDIYRVTWKGAANKVSIYINMYDADSLKAPVGFTIIK